MISQEIDPPDSVTIGIYSSRYRLKVCKKSAIFPGMPSTESDAFFTISPREMLKLLIKLARLAEY